MSKKAVHFGAGNIGRGFIGLLEHEAGYEVVFADVSAALIDALNAQPSYQVHEVGESGHDHTVTGYRGINSAEHEDDLVHEIATADVVTTAVGPTILRFVAPVINRGIESRDPSAAPLAVMACENAINATDVLVGEMKKAAGDWETIASRAVFANTAVDRIVPAQDPNAGLDVAVEPFFEWAVEQPPFGDEVPDLPGATFVPSLAPYIERKLFTVNTGHATAAYAGFAAGHHSIAESLADPAVADLVKRVQAETSTLLSRRHGLDPDDLARYREKILNRFAEPALPDTVERVGRQPLRKLSGPERFIGPAGALAEAGLPVDALVEAVGKALQFDVPEDPQSVELQKLLADLEPGEFVTQVTGLGSDHPLFGALTAVVADRQANL
ncbi:mannitol-1-phosphate 5-dehydrogenase [Acidipropionibacterium jensenii]|uniref:mannitol-1-phosphate 5-dehydrogenase n=1 Tax=Acidipropionibacterium jensenii TaxID=1749 RepID=UPI000BC32213|nr:mannitol-1-phosphate 5-dehydrogenase [Acidipropionibacterium jensenii]AZZ40954.1 mannitol-1-phosphate 5-dehydrogenase [Acidipropionibacterium jensenii]